MIGLRHIRTNPFSVMALCNIAGDLGYLGFAFESEGFVSVPKLLGALFTLIAHILLLAFGDDQAELIAGETGFLPRLFLRARLRAKKLLAKLPDVLHSIIRKKPVGISFGMLALNGLGLCIDAFFLDFSYTFLSQSLLGICIVCGCTAFSLADFCKKQKTANILLKTAPTILTGASVSNALLALTTLNPFVIASVFAFCLSNVAGFYTKIDKNNPDSREIYFH